MVVDCVGREIKPGCTVLYPVRRGSKMWQSRMQVQQVVPGEGKLAAYLAGFNNEGRRVSVHNLSNVVVLVPLGARFEAL